MQFFMKLQYLTMKRSVLEIYVMIQPDISTNLGNQRLQELTEVAEEASDFHWFKS